MVRKSWQTFTIQVYKSCILHLLLRHKIAGKGQYGQWVACLKSTWVLFWVWVLSSALTYCPHMVLTQTHHPWVSKNATHPKERELDLSMCSAHWSLSDVWAGPVAVHHGISGCGLRHNVPCLGSWWCDGKLFPLLLIFDVESVIPSLWLKLILSPKPRLSLIVFLCYLSIGMDACELNDSSFPRLFEVINHMFLFSVAPLHNPCLHTGIYPQSPHVILHIFPV